MINYFVEKKEDHTVSDWPGGKTTQFAIYPKNATGGTGFDYEFEITSSTTELEYSTYTIYAGYMRTLMITRGAVDMIHEDEPTLHLSNYAYDYFDGACQTYVEGLATDYELMVKKGYHSDIRVLQLKTGFEERITLNGQISGRYYYGIYCDTGSVFISLDSEILELACGDQFSCLMIDENANLKIRISGFGTAILSHIDFSV